MAVEVSIPRISELAHPKQLPGGYFEDRRSVYWIDRYPPQPDPETGTTVFVLSPRQEQLVYAKRVHPLWKGDRPTPIWPVEKSAQTVEASERLQYLAQDRPVHTNYMFDRPVYTEVQTAAKNTEPSSRLEQLAISMPWKNVNNIEYAGWDWKEVIWPSRVSAAAKKAVATERIEVLSLPKMPDRAFRGERSIRWPISDDTKKAVATLRVQQLARPRSRTTVNDDYDPYKVTTAARHSRATPRVGELSLPIPRKIRQKKVVAS